MDVARGTCVIPADETDMADQAQVTGWLTDLSGPNPHAAVDQLMDALYPELHRLAQKLFRAERADHTLQPTALVHEVYLRPVDQTRVTWEGRAHFMAIAAKVKRRVLIDHARGHGGERRGGGWKITSLDSDMQPAAYTPSELFDLNAALERPAALDERQARVVEMRFFGGVNNDEIAAALGVSKRTVEDDWTHAKAWLRLVLARESDA